MSENAESKKCPHCAEVIKAEATKCKHCGEKLESSSSSASQDHQRAFAVHGRCKGARRLVYLKAISEEALRAEQLKDWTEIASVKEIKSLPCRNCPGGFMIEGFRSKFNPWGILWILLTVVVYQVSLVIFSLIGPFAIFAALAVAVIYNIWAWSSLSRRQKVWKCGYCNTSMDQGPKDTVSLSL